MQGWIKIHRQLQDKGYINKPAYVSLWVNLLLLANHKEREVFWNGNLETIKRGQFITGRKELSKLTGIPETTIERILKVFESGHQIEQQKTNKYRLITILNWDKYQVVDNKWTTNGHQTDTNKNVKNNNKRTTMKTIDYDSGEIIDPKPKPKGKNKQIIDLALLFEKLGEKETGVKPDLTRAYFKIAGAMKSHNLSPDDVKDLFRYFFADVKLGDEKKVNLGLCVSGSYITQWKVAQKNKQVSQVEASGEIKL